MNTFTEPTLCLIKAGFDFNTFPHKSQVCSLAGSPDGPPEHVPVVPTCPASRLVGAGAAAGGGGADNID